MKSFRNLLLKSCFLISTLVSIDAYSAQPSAAQIAQFQKLPSGQQQALAKQFGVDINGLKSSANASQELAPAIIPSSQPRPEMMVEELSNEEKFLLKNTQKELKPFGYDIFSNAPSTFNPVANIAIPSDYIIGVGDNVSLQVFGKESAEYQLVVSPEGKIFVPELGQFQVAGLSFSELKRFLVDKVKERIIGVDAIVSLAELKSIRVFVLGDAYKPGAYTLSSLSSMSHALFSAGGVNDIGSLRKIQLKRAGKLIQNFDLYDLLIKGDASSDVLLQSGDVVFIESKGKTIAVSGEVRRPAIYEVLDNNNVGDVISMAGGLLPNAHKELVTIERINNSFRTAVNLDLTKSSHKTEPLYDGDKIKVRAKSQLYRNSITLIGAVTRPGKYQWQQGAKISDIFQNIDESLLPDADLLYSLVLREMDIARNIEVHQFSLADALSDPRGEDNLLLKSSDKIIVFSQQEGLTDDQFSLENLAYTQQDLLQKSQLNAKDQFEEKEFWDKYGNSQAFQTDTNGENSDEFNQSLSSITTDETRDNKTLSTKEYGVFSRQRLLGAINKQLIRQSSSGKPLQLVEIDGQVKFPGTYPLAKNSRLNDVVIAAGGVKESAYLTRIDITRNTIMNADSDIFQAGQISKENIQLNLAKALSGDVDNNVMMNSKDRLYIHTIPSWSENQTIELKGEFVFPGRYTIQRGDTLLDIINRAGGFTSFASIEGSIFTREKLKALEQENITKLTNDLRLEFASKSLTEDSSITYADSQQLIQDLAQLSPIGRLVINLENIVDKNRNNRQNILLEKGDVLFVPSVNNSINVIGQVQVTSSHLYDENKDLFDYINKSGGIKKRADKDHIYIIAANGSVKIIKQNKSWFASNSGSVLQPGDTIVVPLDSDYIKNIDLWSAATTIIFNSAVALAAIGSI